MPTSPLTDDRALTTRRRFLKIITSLLGFFMAVILTVPLLASLIGPALRRTKIRWTKIGRVPEVGSLSPVRVSFNDVKEDAYIRENVTRDVWMANIPDRGFTVYSPICPHLGCRYMWDSARGHFICPCHGSVFALDGTVLGGPAPRPLDTLPAKVENGELFIKWERFEPGAPKKIRV